MNNFEKIEYNDDFLIKRLFDKLENSVIKKLIITKPILERKNRKTFVTNFGEVCKSLGRDEEVLREFIEKKLGKLSGDVTISAGSVLIITGSYQSTDIEKYLADYTRTFVLCAEPKCGSGVTELLKENRILYMHCKKCNSKRAITS